MKIKPASRKKKVNPNAYYYWMVDEKPKKVGRLSQLTKWNKRIKKILGGSELQVMLNKEAYETA